MNKEDDIKILVKTDVDGSTRWKGTECQKKESDNEREQELIHGIVDRQDAERAAVDKERGMVYKEQKKLQKQQHMRQIVYEKTADQSI